MRAADCPRRFVLMADGGVRVVYGCGDAVEDPDEVAVDLAILEDRVDRHHHHHRLPRHGR